MDWVSIVWAILVACIALAAALLDVRTRRLPNWLTVSACAAGLVFQVSRGGFAGLGTALGGFAVGFGILFVLWLIGGGGGGDVKLMGALGVWLGPLPTLVLFFLSAFFTALGMIAVLSGAAFQHGYSHVRRRYLGRAPARASGASAGSEAAAQERLLKRRVIPYALPVAFGTWLVVAWQLLVQQH
jgi:prepilin peptidase CpaA